jgi:hypothetical protein
MERQNKNILHCAENCLPVWTPLSQKDVIGLFGTTLYRAHCKAAGGNVKAKRFC